MPEHHISEEDTVLDPTSKPDEQFTQVSRATKIPEEKLRVYTRVMMIAGLACEEIPIPIPAPKPAE